MKSPPRHESEDENLNPEDTVQTSPSSVDPLRGVRASGGVVKNKSGTEVEFSRLKNLVPSISKKSSVTKLDVILEAIRYIDQLQDQLLEQIQDRRINPQAAANLLLGATSQKENFNSAGSVQAMSSSPVNGELLQRLKSKAEENIKENNNETQNQL